MILINSIIESEGIRIESAIKNPEVLLRHTKTDKYQKNSKLTLDKARRLHVQSVYNSAQLLRHKHSFQSTVYAQCMQRIIYHFEHFIHMVDMVKF